MKSIENLSRQTISIESVVFYSLKKKILLFSLELNFFYRILQIVLPRGLNSIYDAHEYPWARQRFIRR